eukprot:TRINITY_DN52537_c0_g1_i1.p1 TRINITY_DN52537_c0_g1~~TRINITY_DN52537_c0_g1_i1.p1  ORF type:complete len:172 (-),score=40.33 TRINITY_DN52537_c0_g1_i1:56-571(-)
MCIRDRKKVADSGPADDDAKYLDMLNTRWTKEPPKSGLCIESFYWRRLIVDEVHEMISHSTWATPLLHGIFAHSRWGLTGTPTVAEPEGVALISKFLQMGPPSSCAEFVSNWVRSSKLAWVGPKPEESITQVTLSDQELVLYLSLIHISEPTRLLSISYAVFCLKKKKKQE